jgi:hypothetical protein
MKKALVYFTLPGLGIHAWLILWLAERSDHGVIGFIAVIDVAGSVVSVILLGWLWVLERAYPPRRPDIWEVDVSWQFRLASSVWWPLLILANFFGIYPNIPAART